MLIDLLDLLATPACDGCGNPGRRWCGNCARIAPLPARIDVGLPVLALLTFEGPVRRSIIDWKERGNREAGERLARWLAQGLELAMVDIGSAVVVPVPPSRTARRRRGGDPLLALTRQAAAGRIPVLPWLASSRDRVDQAGLDRRQRERNLAGSLRWIGATDKTIILVDDVVTTGATLRECARAARAGGASRVSAVVIAQREHDSPVATGGSGLRLS